MKSPSQETGGGHEGKISLGTSLSSPFRLSIDLVQSRDSRPAHVYATEFIPLCKMTGQETGYGGVEFSSPFAQRNEGVEGGDPEQGLTARKNGGESYARMEIRGEAVGVSSVVACPVGVASSPSLPDQLPS